LPFSGFYTQIFWVLSRKSAILYHFWAFFRAKKLRFFGQFFTFSGKHTIFSGKADDFQKIT